MKNMYLVLTLVFAAITLGGIIYMFANGGNASPGYSIVPMVFVVIFGSLYKREKRKE